MKLKTLAQALTLSCLLSAASVSAGQAIVCWEDITKFSDVEAGVNIQSTFNDRLKTAVNKYLSELAEQMPAGYKWEVQIHDIDLAGKISRAYRNDRQPLRVYDTFFNPSMKISYRVTDSNGKVIANDKHFKITDRYAKQYRSRTHRQRFLSYEKAMMKAWFKKVVLPFVEQS